MAKTTSDFLIKRITEWGIRRIYGYPGDGINGIIGAIDRAGDAIQYIQVRHEEMAAFMACAHSKFTGEVGVCADDFPGKKLAQSSVASSEKARSNTPKSGASTDTMR